MPIYTYRCNDCDYQFEKRQRMADDPLTECIDCEVGNVRRVVNSVGIVFKGSGFYVTDNRNGKVGSTSVQEFHAAIPRSLRQLGPNSDRGHRYE